jgi:hypothetical protein
MKRFSMVVAVCLFGACSAQNEEVLVDEAQAALTANLDGTTYEGDYEGIAQEWIRDLASDQGEYHFVLQATYGDDYDAEIAEDLRHRIIDGDFSWMPVVQVVKEGALRGHLGAFAESVGVVYLSRAVVNQPVASMIYLEEIGHYLDSLLVGQDSPGDEGSIFRLLVSGESLSSEKIAQLRNVNDHGFIRLGRKYVPVEFFSITAPFKAAGRWIWSGVKSIGDGAGWLWDHKNALFSPCAINIYATLGGCGACIIAIAAAPETGGATLAAAKVACGTTCVTTFTLMMRECLGKESFDESSDNFSGTDSRVDAIQIANPKGCDYVQDPHTCLGQRKCKWDYYGKDCDPQTDVCAWNKTIPECSGDGYPCRWNYTSRNCYTRR